MTTNEEAVAGAIGDEPERIGPLRAEIVALKAANAELRGRVKQLETRDIERGAETKSLKQIVLDNRGDEKYAPVSFGALPKRPGSKLAGR